MEEKLQRVINGELDDDLKPRRTGTQWTASAHIITAVIGSGVLSLAWAVAQLGWILGVTTLVIFSGITLYTSGLLADCYRFPDPVSGKRNYTYMEAVKVHLDGKMYMLCGVAQYTNFIGTTIGYTITASRSMEAVFRSNCFHKEGHEAPCSYSVNRYMIGMGILEIFLSQIPNLHKLSLVSVVAAVMSFGYSSIGMGLAFAQVVSGHGKRTTLTGVEVSGNVTPAEKTWRMFQAFGNIAFAYSYSQVLIEIQNTLRSSPPENIAMKKANVTGVLTTTVFYMMCGCFGYAAFGNNAPGNLLTGFGFYEPFWLVDLANMCIVLHLVGSYQIFSQPLFSAVEQKARNKWPNSKFLVREYKMNIDLGKKYAIRLNLFRLTWRTAFVILATIVAMVLPFFNDVLALLGALVFWPLTVFFPTQMYITKKSISKWSSKWLVLNSMNLLCFLVAVAATCGSLQGLGKALSTYKPFKF